MGNTSSKNTVLSLLMNSGERLRESLGQPVSDCVSHWASRFASRYRSEPWPDCRRARERSARRERVPSEIGGAEGFRSVTALTGAYRSTMGRNRFKNSVQALVTFAAENTPLQSVASKSESKACKSKCLKERHSITRDLKRGRGRSNMARVK